MINVAYAPRLAMFLLLFVNLPLNISWFLSAKHTMNGDLVNAYRANTLFRTIYALRLAFFIFGGLAFLVMCNNHNNTADYFCSRYYGIADVEGMTEDQLLKQSDCRAEVRTVGWIIYFPWIIFQTHCFITINKFRETIENVEFRKSTDVEEEI